MTKVLDKAIAAFVTDVKAALVGQDPSVIADLTDNLEADLLDRQAAEGDEFKLGNPKAYANELLASAGLLSVAGASRVSLFWKEVGRGALNFAKTLRPAWWVFRAYLSYVFFWHLFVRSETFIPVSGFAWLYLAVALVISVQIGRGTIRGVWRKWWLRVPLVLLNIFAVLFAYWWAFGVYQIRGEYAALRTVVYSGSLVQNARLVNSAYAYDITGRQLPMVVLKDENGGLLYQQPVNLTKSSDLSALVGSKVTDAENALTNLGYSVVITYQHLARFKPGRVASVNLVPDGAEVVQVQLVVSK